MPFPVRWQDRQGRPVHKNFFAILIEFSVFKIKVPLNRVRFKKHEYVHHIVRLCRTVVCPIEIVDIIFLCGLVFRKLVGHKIVVFVPNGP